MQNAVDHAFPEGSRATARSRCACARDDDHVDDRGARQRRRACPSEFSLDRSRGLGLSIVQALVTERAAAARSRCTATTARRCACASRSRCRGSSCRRVEPCVERERWPTLGGGFDALAEPAALLLGEPAPDAGFLVGAERELEALAGDGALRRRPAWRRRSGRARRRWCRSGRRARGSCRGTMARSRHASASQSWVRIQVNATFSSPLVGRTGPRDLCARVPVRPITELPGQSLSGERRHAG